MLFFLLELSISRIYRKRHDLIDQSWTKRSDHYDRVSSKILHESVNPWKDEVIVPIVPKRKIQIDKLLRPKTRPIKNRPDFEACFEIDGQPYSCIKMPWWVYDPR